MTAPQLLHDMLDTLAAAMAESNSPDGEAKATLEDGTQLRLSFEVIDE